MSRTIYTFNLYGELVPVGKKKRRHNPQKEKFVGDTPLINFLNGQRHTNLLDDLADDDIPVGFVYPSYRFRADTALEVLDSVLRDPHVKWDSDQIKDTFVERLNAIMTEREGEKALAGLGTK